MRPSLCLLAALFVAGCTSGGKASFPESRLAGQFCIVSIDAASCLRLKADHTYTERFLDGGGTGRIGAQGEILFDEKLTEEGTWRLENDRVRLFPVEGKKRILKIEQVADSIQLRESTRSYSREYRQ